MFLYLNINTEWPLKCKDSMNSVLGIANVDDWNLNTTMPKIK